MSEKYEKSISKIKEILKTAKTTDEELSRKKWNEIASADMLRAEELVKEADLKRWRDFIKPLKLEIISEEIEIFKKNMLHIREKHGIKSDEDIQLCKELNIIINKYYDVFRDRDINSSANYSTEEIMTSLYFSKEQENRLKSNNQNTVEQVKKDNIKYVDVSKRNINTRKIDRLKIKLNKTIEKYGIGTEEVRKLSLKLDKLINEYYKRQKQFPEWSNMLDQFNYSYEHLKEIAFDLDNFPTIGIWNGYAKKNNCLNSTSMQYISGLNWNGLRDRVMVEKNSKKS